MPVTSTPREDRRYWVWVTGPDYYLDEDGSERRDLDPGQGYEPGGWWTCHRETEEGDLVLLYRSQKKKDLAYLIETRSAAYSLLDDDDAPAQGWDYGCDFEVVEKFANPLTLVEMRADRALEDWGALRAGFRRRVYAISPDTWNHLLDRLGGDPRKAGTGAVTKQQAVSPRALDRSRRKAAALAEHLSPEAGWIVDTTTAAKIVSLFPCLSVRPGVRLVTVAARAGIGGNGWTFAIPEGFEVPSPEALERAAVFPPEPPRGAFVHVMDVIDGDGSLRSYIQASILRRELEELGAWWHGLEWSMHRLLDNGVAPEAPNVCSDSDDDRGPLTAAPEWRWEAPAPDDWRPTIERAGPDTVAVMFFTTTALGRFRITRHVDVYESGSLRPQSTEHTIAEGPEGLVF